MSHEIPQEPVSFLRWPLPKLWDFARFRRASGWVREINHEYGQSQRLPKDQPFTLHARYWIPRERVHEVLAAALVRESRWPKWTRNEIDWAAFWNRIPTVPDYSEGIGIDAASLDLNLRRMADSLPSDLRNRDYSDVNSQVSE